MQKIPETLSKYLIILICINIKYKTGRDAHMYNIFKRILTDYDTTVKNYDENDENGIYTNWYELNIDFYTVYESARLLNRNKMNIFKEKMMLNKNIILEGCEYKQHQISFLVTFIHCLSNKK